MFEITAGPMPQDQQLHGQTGSFFPPPVLGTGRESTGGKSIKLNAFLVVFIRKTFEILIFVKEVLANAMASQSSIVSVILVIFQHQWVVIRVLCHSILFRPISRHVKPPPQVTFHSSSKGKNPEDVTGSLVKSPIIGRFLQFKDQFWSIFRKHFISVLHFAIRSCILLQI